MERKEFKWVAGTLGLFVIALFFLFSASWRNSEARNPMEDWLTVSMPRPIKEMILGFSLSGRNIKRELEMVAQAKKADAKVDKKDAKGATKAAVDKGGAAGKRAAQLREAARRRQEQIFRARIVQESERYRRMLQQQNQVQDFQDDRSPARSLKKNADNSNVNGANAVEQEEEKEKMDPAAWKSLVLSQPTAANIQKMVQALQSGDIDAQTYFEIVESLVKDNSEEKRKMGLWALTSTSHENAFSMASHIVAEVDAESQKKLNDYMYSYNNARTLTILDSVLRSSDMVAATAAAQVITRAIDKLKAGQGVGNADVRAGRTQSQSQTLTLATYQRLIPTLQWLSAKSGSTLSQWAQNLLSQLRSNTSAA